MEAGRYKGMKVGAIIQARMGSSRLPGKVLMPMPINESTTVLDCILSRVPNTVTAVIATSNASTDDPIREKYPNCFRGDELDVLKRFYDCAVKHEFDQVIRLTGDNPAVDSTVMEDLLDRHVELNADYSVTKGLPLGVGVEIIKFSALEIAFNEATDSFDREHVTPYLKKDSNKSRFKLNEVFFEGFPEIRLTVDYPSDYAMLSLIYSKLGNDFSVQEIKILIAENPWISDINSTNKQLS